MRVGYCSADDSDDVAMTLVPVGHDEGGSARRGLTRAGAVAALSTQSGAELTRQCPLLLALLPRLAAALAAQRAEAPTQIFALDELSEAERDLLVDVLGEGEVGGIVALPDRRIAQIQESVLAGLWLIRIEGDAAQPRVEYVEVGAIPELVRRAAQDFTLSDVVLGAAPADAMNVMPVLAEIRERKAAHRAGMPSHVINFTLLPMNAVDMAHLQATLGNGPIQLHSRGYGSCRVLATATRDVWSVQFLNAMDTMILDTLEIGDVPAAACAADEDFSDSAERLGEIIEAYFE
ncbi:hydrogenase expression/formation protein [Rhodopseudomonas palustris]|uniref:HupH hydrogenase expression protein n=1 Tax=Rhodopseudomonas palustris (strain BisB18) TaxID=316056 RepID=Q20ZY5_RHOPB